MKLSAPSIHTWKIPLCLLVLCALSLQLFAQVSGADEQKTAKLKLAAPENSIRDKSRLSKARVAIVIDDVGYKMKAFYRLLDVDAPLTFAVLPEAPHSKAAARVVLFRGRELILHLPMEPTGYPDQDPGPRAITTWLSDKAIRKFTNEHIDRFPGIVGVNNHMGSRFTQDARRMEIVLLELKKRGLFFLDSRTSPNSVGYQIAGRLEIPAAQRTYFFDDTQDEQHSRRKLRMLARHARAHGEAIGIGHPHPTTVAAIEKELPMFERYGVEIVPLSQLVH